MQCMAFGWWNFQMVGLEQVSNAEMVLCLVYFSVSISTVDLITMKFQANKHPPLDTYHTQ